MSFQDEDSGDNDKTYPLLVALLLQVALLLPMALLLPVALLLLVELLLNQEKSVEMNNS